MRVPPVQICDGKVPKKKKRNKYLCVWVSVINCDGLQSKGDLYLPQQIHWDEVWKSAAPAISNDLEKV